MASHRDSSGLGALFRWLVAHRLAVYVGGLLAIVAPRLLRRFTDVSLGPTVRTVIVGVSLGAMILTYLGEQRVSAGGSRVSAGSGTGSDSDPAGEGTASGTEPTVEASRSSEDSPQYSRRTRAVFAASVLGVVFGVYVALDVSVPAGLLFVFGAILFGQSAYRRDRGSEAGERRTSGDSSSASSGLDGEHE